MVERDPGANERLIARARVKAALQGTTLEAELVAWLERYVDVADETLGERRTDIGAARRSRPPAASPASSRPERPRRDGQSRPPASRGDEAGSRATAYRRLLLSMRDTSPRTPRGRGEGESER